jgi:hypothetical protein
MKMTLYQTWLSLEISLPSDPEIDRDAGEGHGVKSVIILALQNYISAHNSKIEHEAERKTSGR